MTISGPDIIGTTRVETLRWRDGALEMIDQRLLPLRFEYRRCANAREVAEAIRTMVVRGAPAIGVAAAYGLALEVAQPGLNSRDAQIAAFERAFSELAASRPTAVNLMWGLNRQRAVMLRTGSLRDDALPEALLAEAHAILREDVGTNHLIGRHGAELIADGARVLTHCNAGALATAGHGTALGVIRSAVADGKRISVYADETRPLLQGARLTAWELAQDGIPVTLIADSAAALLMSRGEIDLVVVGADRVAANGDTANKIGTYPLAVMAQRHAVPFYVACPLSTLDQTLAHGGLIPIEERGAGEITTLAGIQTAPGGIQVRNPAFDVTPAALINGLITERGVLFRPDRAGIAALLSSTGSA
jgi:methylthioribose-1-phosphate isomerase